MEFDWIMHLGATSSDGSNLEGDDCTPNYIIFFFVRKTAKITVRHHNWIPNIEERIELPIPGPSNLIFDVKNYELESRYLGITKCLNTLT